MLSVLVVEDDPATQDFFRESIQADHRLALVGVCENVSTALTWLQARQEPLDVLLTDLGLPDGSGLEVIRSALVRFPACDALVISMFGDDESVLASIEAGAVGYLHKDDRSEDIAGTILQVRQGASPISPMVARRVLLRYRMLAEAPPAPDTPTADEPVTLSGKEQAVLELIARGFSYAEIARLQDISVHTVQTHIKKLYQKLAVHSRSEAVFEATRMGLLKGMDPHN